MFHRSIQKAAFDSVSIIYHNTVLYEKPQQQQFRLACWPQFYSVERWTESMSSCVGDRGVHREREFPIPISMGIPWELLHENERNRNLKLIKLFRVLCCSVVNWQSLKLWSDLCYPVHHTVWVCVCVFKGLKLVLCSARVLHVLYD